MPYLLATYDRNEVATQSGLSVIDSCDTGVAVLCMSWGSAEAVTTLDVIIQHMHELPDRPYLLFATELRCRRLSPVSGHFNYYTEGFDDADVAVTSHSHSPASSSAFSALALTLAISLSHIARRILHSPIFDSSW